jgi:inorganic pyrophosphatase
MPSLSDLPPYDDGVLRIVVETPRGNRLKLAFDTQCEAFVVKRELMTGLVSPYDFGLAPGTRAEDGDPVDAMVLHTQCTYPGAVLPCRARGSRSSKQFFVNTAYFTSKKLRLEGWKLARAVARLIERCRR